MKCLLLLFMCWCSSILPVTSCIRVVEHSCRTTFWNTITCVLNISGNPAEQSNTTYSLKFTHCNMERSTVNCSLVMINHNYSCDCQVSPDFFYVSDSYDIELCHESGCLADPLEKDFQPSRNIQLSPPVEVKVNSTPENIIVTWKSGYEAHELSVNQDIIYQFVLQATSRGTSIGEDTPQNVSSGKLLIPRSQLEPGAKYCIKVRSFPKHGDFEAHWSNWCPSVCWKNGAEEASSEQENILVTLTKSLVPVCVVVGVLLFVFYSPAARMKIKNLSHTPSPATFFQPLFQQHEGNVKEWLSSKGKYMLTYTAEEILTSDAIIVVPKPIAKDPEENPHKTPITQLTFTQCQTSYVGLPGIHEASPPLTMVCPGNMSYTRLPCPAWGVEVGEVEVVSPSPEDIFNISHSDSGCEDPTQSPECSSPNSPVEDTPPPCYCNDYCILNKTADGFAPVLVSKDAV